MEPPKNSEYNWIIQTVLFMAALLTIFGVIHHYPRWGIILAVFTVVTVFVACYLRAKNMYFLNRNNKKDNNTDNKTFDVQIEPNELKSAQRLLRYSTAILAFLSLTTTSQGMQSFVFGTGWMAYLGSFAVQGILVVFSLLLCHFLVTISYLGWPEHIRKAASTGLILFFCVALVVSSSFSYSYISNYAYKDSWAVDREAMISHELLTTAYALNEENSKRKEYAFTNVIKASQVNLTSTLASSQETKINELKTELLKKALNFNVSKIDDEEISQIYLDKDEFNHNVDIQGRDSLYSFYQQDYADSYKAHAKSYNDLIDMITAWKNANPDTIPNQQGEFRQIVNSISLSIEEQKKLAESIENWKVSTNYINATTHMGKVRSHYINASNSLCVRLALLSDQAKEFTDLFDEYNGISSNTAGSNLNQILKDILMLQLEDNNDIHVTSIIEQISTIASEASSSEHFDVNEIEKIINLRDGLLVYSECVKLGDDIKGYLNNELSKNYYIFPDKSDIPDVVLDESVVVTETAWQAQRTKDVTTLLHYVKMLPSIVVIDNKPRTESGQNNAMLATGYEQRTEFDQEEAMLALEKMQRNYLGNLSDFEKAFLYMDSWFPMMAFFSAFVAVFFDLGSFFTGCFLYASKYIDRDNKGEEKDKEKADGADTESQQPSHV